MTNDTRCILSCDGGGIRGIVTTVLLEELEVRLQAIQPDKTLRDYFDIIAGTSTGSLIACGISKGYRANQIRGIYRERGIKIFPRFWDVLKSIISRITFGYSQPIYDGKGLEKVLQDPEVFGNDLFEDLPNKTIVTCYDTYNRQAVVFINSDPHVSKLKTWEVCRASAAAPVAFPGYLLEDPTFIQFWKDYVRKKGGIGIPVYQGKEVIPLIDGGVFANNPALCAIANRLIWNDEPSRKDLVVVSFGTGQNVKEIGVKEALGWGGLDWASPAKGIPILDVVGDGSSDVVDYVSSKLLDDEKYFRFQPTLIENLPAFNAGKKNIAQLEAVAEAFLKTEKVRADLDRLVQVLIERSKL
jgi:uncharacterized protein